MLGLTSAARTIDAPPIVRVYVAGSADAVRGSRDAIQDLCSRSNVAVVVRDAAGADEALLAASHPAGLADAYVDLRAGSPRRVVVVDGQTRKDLERRSLPEDASLEISIETMAHVVCAAVESSLAARAAAPAKAPTTEQSKPNGAGTQSSAERSKYWQTRASVFGSGANFGAGFRAGLGGGLGLNQGQAPWHFGALFSLIGYPEAGVESANGLASFGLLGVRAIPLLEWQPAEAVTAFAGIGPGIDWIQMSGERPPPGAMSTATGTVMEPVASGILGLRLALGRGLSALLAADTDVALTSHRYVAQTTQGPQTFFQPSRLHPMALAGFSLSLGGPNEPRGSRSEARR